MTSTPDRIRRAYELGRLRTAALGALPALLYLGASAVLGADQRAIVIGIGMFLLAAVALHRGRPLARGVGLGFLLGVIPFATASFAQSAGHVCIDGSCMAYCVPACTTAGVATGLLGSYLAVRVRGGIGSYASMAVLVTMAGAMGCRCIGIGSMVGLVTGLLVASVPAMPRIVADTRTT